MQVCRCAVYFDVPPLQYLKLLSQSPADLLDGRHTVPAQTGNVESRSSRFTSIGLHI